MQPAEHVGLIAGRRPIPTLAEPTDLLTLDEIGSRLERVLAASPADETELVWLEVLRGRAATRGRGAEAARHRDRTILVRVIDRARVGSHRTGIGEPAALESAVRLAIAQSRSRQPLPGLLHLPAEEAPPPTLDGLFDPEIADLDDTAARRKLSDWALRRTRLELTWAEARVTVFSSRGLRRQARVTAATLDVRCGRRPGGGRATAAARSLERLRPREVVERAQRRHAEGRAAEPPTAPVAVVLSPEAMGQLCDLLNQVAFSAISYYQGSSFLREHLDVQVFDRSFNLKDDATDPAGLAFPFDLEGTAKRPVDLIAKGTPRTPALDQRQAARMGLEPTAHAIGGNDARALNLFLLAGETGEEELLRAAEEGVWIGWLDRIECFEPARVQIRARARGVRRITAGRLAEGLPDLHWEDSLLRAFSSLQALGSEAVLMPSHDGYLGGTSAPAAVISGVGGLRPDTAESLSRSGAAAPGSGRRPD